MKTYLCAKYTNNQSVENFYRPYKLGDGYEEQAFRLDKANYFTRYETGEMLILLQITKSGSRVGLSIVYTTPEAIKGNIEQEKKETENTF